MAFFGDDFTKRDPLPDHNTEAAIRFLQRFNPAGPWVLVAIPLGESPTGKTFEVEDWRGAAEWIESWQGKANIYFHVNPLSASIIDKAAKTDVKSLAWLYVDIDPRALGGPASDDADQPGEHVRAHFAEERARILGLLNKAPKRPTVIVDSGGGYQGFWRLRPSDKLEINGDLEKAQVLEAYNVQLEREFGGDHCHNVDRIMRLPGTINLPTLKKRKRGRVPAVAAVVEWAEVDYPLEAFVPAPRVQPREPQKGLGGGSRPRVSVPGNTPDVSCEDLREWAEAHSKTISDSTLAMISVGHDPIDPGKYPSRSEALFKVCCDLVRADVPVEMIFGVITGQNGIAESVREKPNYETYALRQIERAREEVIDPVLREFNEKHAVIADIGGKCRIISEVWDPALKRTRVSKQSFEDFRNRYRNRRVTVGVDEKGNPIQKPAGTFWIDHPNRRQYDSIVFSPGHDTEDSYNLWNGFGCASLPGDKHESFLAHVRDNICSGNPDHFEYMINWLAMAVQHPDGPGEVSVVMRGPRGTGKSFFVKQFGRLWGRHFLQVSNSKHLVGSFNAHLRDTVILFGDEAFFAGDKQHESVLKTLITEDMLIVEGKGVDAEAAPNYVHLLMASNDSWVVPAGLDERRFFVLEVGEGKKQDHAYFDRIKRDLDEGGLENLLHYLLTKNLEDYNVRRVPQTEALQGQKILSMSPETEWFYNLVWEGRLLSSDLYWPEKVVVELLYEDYLKRMEQQRRGFRLNLSAFGRFLGNVLPKGWPRKGREIAELPVENRFGEELIVKKRAYVYYMPSLEETRAHWDQYLGGPFVWPPVDPKQASIEVKPQSPF